MKLIEENVLYVGKWFCQNLSAKNLCLISKGKSEFELMIFTQSLPCRQTSGYLSHHTYCALNDRKKYVLIISASG